MGKLFKHPLAQAASEWLGVSYKHQGRSRQGVDSFGFVKVLLALKLDVAPSAYSPLAEGEPFLDCLEANGLKPVPFRKAQPGDVLCFRISPANSQGHHVASFGFKTSRETFIHASMSLCVRETRIVPWWERRLAYAYRP